MGRKLRCVPVENGLMMSEKACEDYVCASCGRKMISVNFVNGICIQVFVSHGDACTFYEGNAFKRTVEVSCESCKYYDSAKGRCTNTAEADPNINSCRTAGWQPANDRTSQPMEESRSV